MNWLIKALKQISKILFSILLLSIALNCWAIDIDGLKSKLKSAKQDSSKVELLNEYINQIEELNPFEALDSADVAISLAQKIGYKKGLSDALNFKGVLFKNQGDLENALEYLLRALALNEELNIQSRIATSYNNIGLIYKHQENYEKALAYYNKCLEINTQEANKKGLAMVLNNIGVVFKNLKDYDKALENYKLALEINLELNNEKWVSYNYNNIGRIYLERGLYDEAYEYFLESLQINTQIQNTQGVGSTYVCIGDIFNKQKNYLKAEEYYIKAVKACIEVDAKLILSEAYSGLALNSASNGKYKDAFDYLSKYSALKDSLINEDAVMKMAKLENKYDKDRLQRELELLEKDKALNEANLKNREFVLAASIVGIVLLVFLVLVLVQGNRKLRIAFEQLNNQKAKIETINNTLIQQKKEIESQKESLANKKEELEKINNLLGNQNEELTKLNEDKNNYLRIIAHDLRSPMHLIMGLVEVLMIKVQDAGVDVDKIGDIQKHIKSQATRITDLVNRILDVDLIEAKDLNVVYQPVIINNLIEEIINNQRGNAKVKNIQLSFDMMMDMPAIDLDRNFTLQIFDNLLSNAIKFSPLNSIVEIETKVINYRVHVCFTDHGAGIQPDEFPLLFKKYQKLSTRPTNKETSTGLGLSIVKKFVDAMNGSITCTSKPGENTTFCVEFPLK